MKQTNKRTISRQQDIRNEIYKILHEETHKWLNFINSRENNMANRLNAIEQAGVPQNVLEKINQDISAIRYTIRKQTQAIEELLKFFNVSKNLFENETEHTDNSKHR